MAAEAVESRRVFLNHLDSYCGRNIGEYLSRCVIGASLESTEEEEVEEDENNSAPASGPKEGTHYQIVGTLSNPENVKPPFAAETYAVSSQNELLSHLLECDVILYNITEDASQIEEATWAASALHAEIEHFRAPKIFILISTIMSWAKSNLPEPVWPTEVCIYTQSLVITDWFYNHVLRTAKNILDVIVPAHFTISPQENLFIKEEITTSLSIEPFASERQVFTIEMKDFFVCNYMYK